MNAPTSAKVGAPTVWDGWPSVEHSKSGRNSPCPWPWFARGDVAELRTTDGYTAATWCRRCDQAVTRSEWLALLEALT